MLNICGRFLRIFTGGTTTACGACECAKITNAASPPPSIAAQNIRQHQNPNPFDSGKAASVPLSCDRRAYPLLGGCDCMRNGGPPRANKPMDSSLLSSRNVNGKRAGIVPPRCYSSMRDSGTLYLAQFLDLLFVPNTNALYLFNVPIRARTHRARTHTATPYYGDESMPPSASSSSSSSSSFSLSL